MLDAGPVVGTAAQAAVVVTATDLKQWSYCQRIPFYRYVLPVRPAPTYCPGSA